MKPFGKLHLSLGIALVLVGCGHRTEKQPALGTGPPIQFDHQHALLGKILHAVVRNGLVDYPALEPQLSNLRQYLDHAARVPRAQFDGWSPPQRLAFLVNIYNAATLYLLAVEKPLESIKSIGGLRSPWKLKIVRLFGSKWSLDTLEHEWIRKQFQSPQIHFALVCGAKSCPPLRSEPFTATRLEEQFADQAKRFLKDSSKNRVDLVKNIVYLSRIFQWYARDFGKSDAELLRFIAPHFPTDIARQLREKTFTIRYLDYDWSLNRAVPLK